MAWALVTTQPNCERKVGEELTDRKMPFHFFKRKTLSAHRGCLVEKIIPAFPRYMFVPFEKCFDVVREVAGATGVVCFNNRPSLIDQSVVDEIRSRCVGDILIEEESSSKKFKFGDEVIVSSLSKIGKYHHSDRGGRAVVLIEILGRSVFVNVNESELSAYSRKRRSRRSRQREIRKNNYCSQSSSRSLAACAA